MNNIFVKPANEYKRDLDILKHYIDQTSAYIAKVKGVSYDIAKEFVVKTIGKDGKYAFNPPKAVFTSRIENGDKVERTDTIYQYLKECVNDKDIITPTFTSFVNVDIEESMFNNFIKHNVANRKALKVKEARAKAEKKLNESKFYNKQSDASKQINNSFSGALAINSICLANANGHPVLTSTCRTSTANGGAHIERFVAGNRHYFSPDVVISNILSIIRNTDYDKLKAVIAKFNINIPTTQQVLDIVFKISKQYWSHKAGTDKVFDFINTLSGIERAAYLYTGDFHSLRVLNEDLVRDFISRLSVKVTGGSFENPIKLIKNTDGTCLIFAHQVCSEETRGYADKHDTMPMDSLQTLASTITNISKVTEEFAELIQVLFCTDNLLPNVSYMPNSIRHSLLGGDTDSCIYTVQDWVKWYKGDYKYDSTAISVGSAIVYLVDNTLINVLAVMSANMGIHEKDLFAISMKNEYRFNLFIPTQGGKHYFADIGNKEGSEYAVTELEVKGVHLKNSSSPVEIIEAGEEMMAGIIADFKKDGEVSAKKYLRLVREQELNIINSIKRGEHTYLRTGKIKAADTYKGDPNSSPYKKHNFYNETFGMTYGKVPEPPYETVKLSLTTDTSLKFKEWINNMENKELAKRINDWITKDSKNSISTINLPLTALANGVHKELADIIDYSSIVLDICKIFYLILETLGIYVNSKKESPKMVLDIFVD